VGKYFGTDGFRGRVGDVLTATHALRIGCCLGQHFGKGRVLIGKDTRCSGDLLEAALAAGIAATGGEAMLLGVIPTPALPYLIRQGGYDGGVMISASHNPFADNGIKLFGGDGEKLSDAALALPERYLAGEAEPCFVTEGAVGRLSFYGDGYALYRARLLSLAEERYHGLRVGLDAANGSACRLAREVFEALGATVTAIGEQPDGQNINRGCGSTQIGSLCALVREQGLDVGFAFDGDADRCIAVDAAGQVVDGDAILYVMSRALQERGALHGGTVVTTVMSNMGLARALEPLGIACEQTAVGDRYVAERVRKMGYSLGGEQSGHIIFSALSDTGDGLLTAILLADRIRESGLPLQRLTDGYKPYPQLLRSLPIRSAAALREDAALWERLQGLEARLGENGRLLVRPSGTEPVVRIMVQASEASLCERIAERAQHDLTERGHLQ